MPASSSAVACRARLQEEEDDEKEEEPLSIKFLSNKRICLEKGRRFEYLVKWRGKARNYS